MPEPAPISYGDPLARCLHLAFERDFGGTWRDTVCRRVFDLWVTWGGQNVRVTDRRPAYYPGDYGTMVVAIDLPNFGHAGMIGDQEWWLPHTDPRFAPYRAHVGFALAFADPLQTATVAAHEAGHGAGLLDDNVKGSLMNGYVVTPSGRFTAESMGLLSLRTKGQP